MRALVLASREEARAGGVIVAQTSEAIGAVVEASGRLTALVREIARASREQALGVDEVNRALGLLDAATQSNARLAEASAVDAGALAQEAETLRGAVSRFSVRSPREEARLLPEAGPARLVLAAGAA